MATKRLNVDTEKDQLLRQIEDDAHITFKDNEYEAVRKMPTADLFLLQGVLTRAYKAGLAVGGHPLLKPDTKARIVVNSLRKWKRLRAKRIAKRLE